jgi:hypothetical protein
VGRTCTICRHPLVGKIDAELRESTAYRLVASSFNTSESAVYRHSKHFGTVQPSRPGANVVEMGRHNLRNTVPSAGNHRARKSNSPNGATISPRLSHADLIDHLLAIQKCTGEIIERATAEGQSKVALRAIREGRANLALLAKLGASKNAQNSLRADDPSFLREQIQASLLQLPSPERRALLREAPAELAELLREQHRQP